MGGTKADRGGTKGGRRQGGGNDREPAWREEREGLIQGGEGGAGAVEATGRSGKKRRYFPLVV